MFSAVFVDTLNGQCFHVADSYSVLRCVKGIKMKKEIWFWFLVRAKIQISVQPNAEV